MYRPLILWIGCNGDTLFLICDGWDLSCGEWKAGGAITCWLLFVQCLVVDAGCHPRPHWRIQSSISFPSTWPGFSHSASSWAPRASIPRESQTEISSPFMASPKKSHGITSAAFRFQDRKIDCFLMQGHSGRMYGDQEACCALGGKCNLSL